MDVRLATDLYGRRNAGENLLGHFPRCEAADRPLTRGNVGELTRWSRTGVMGIHLPLPAGGGLGRQPSIPSRSDR